MLLEAIPAPQRRRPLTSCPAPVPHSQLGGAVFGAQNVSVDSSLFEATSAEIDGGAVYGGGVALLSSVFRGTLALQNGGAAWAVEVAAENSTFEGTAAGTVRGCPLPAARTSRCFAPHRFLLRS